MTKSAKKDLIALYKRQYPLLFKEYASDEPFLSKRYVAAWDVAKKASTILKDYYGAQKVVVFGSLTSRCSFNRWSDIDLAAWGIPDEKFYAAVGAVTGLTTEFKIDLVDAEECRMSLRKAIEDKGIEI